MVFERALYSKFSLKVSLYGRKLAFCANLGSTKVRNFLQVIQSNSEDDFYIFILLVLTDLCKNCRSFVLGTAVALSVISSSAKISPSFEDHLSSTVIGMQRIYSNPNKYILSQMLKERGRSSLTSLSRCTCCSGTLMRYVILYPETVF